MKSASLELLGLRWFFNLNLPGLHVPLMALVNYRGWRLVCTSALPLGKVPTILCTLRFALLLEVVCLSLTKFSGYAPLWQ